MQSSTVRAIVNAMSRWGIVAIAYTLLGTFAVWLAENVRGHNAFLLKNPWLLFESPWGAHGFSFLLGLAVGGLVVFATKGMVRRFSFAKRLHEELRPLALGLSSKMVLVLAITSAFGEELFFRGLLQPWIGLWFQALVFGFLHQTGGSSRWVWMVWATVMGLVLGMIFSITGSLVGPLVAHALVNALNFAFLKRHNPAPEHRKLGGLLDQRS
jgi:membrane protease YdiL (CAAX protease family)